MHDMSKFYPDEFIPYARHFYGKRKLAEDKPFMEAVFRHYERNPHHPKYWEGEDMPISFVREMIADWAGAFQAKHGKHSRKEVIQNCQEFYLNMKGTSMISIMTEMRIVKVLYEEFL